MSPLCIVNKCFFKKRKERKTERQEERKGENACAICTKMNKILMTTMGCHYPNKYRLISHQTNYD